MDPLVRLRGRESSSPSASTMRLAVVLAAPLTRRDDGVCGAGMRLCPPSLGGDCCPGDYECARESCYATKGLSMCHSHVGWYPCAAVFGGEPASAL